MRKELVVAAALLGLGWVIAANNQAFLNPANLTNTSRHIALLGVLAIGVGFVIVTGGIDLSVGSVVALTAVVFAKLSIGPDSGGFGKPTWMAASIALVVAVFVGWLQGLLIAKAGVQPFIVTLCGMLCFRGVAQTITQGGNLTVSDAEHPRFRSLAHDGFKFQFEVGKDADGVPFFDEFVLGAPLLLLAGVALIAIYVLHVTVFGRHLYAIGGNREAARYAGVPVQFTETMVYMISAGLAGVAGLMYASYYADVTHTSGYSYELYAIAAAVLGGCSLRGGEGSIIGVLLGVTLFRVLENGLNMLQPLLDATIRSDSPLWLVGVPLKKLVGKDWRVDNSKEIVIGLVILGAVLFDRLADAYANYRRKRAVK